jgi:hypothetical protein
MNLRKFKELKRRRLLTMFHNQKTELARVDESPLEVPEPIELELKRLELCMAKPWYRLAMIEHQIVGGGLDCCDRRG